MITEAQCNPFTKTIKISNGYFLGDPHVLQDEYYKLWMKTGYEGLFEKDGKQYLLVGGTAEGDGVYKDLKGNEYGVDVGAIGIIPLEFIDNSRLKKWITKNYVINKNYKGNIKLIYNKSDPTFIFKELNGCNEYKIYTKSKSYDNKGKELIIKENYFKY